MQIHLKVIFFAFRDNKSLHYIKFFYGRNKRLHILRDKIINDKSPDER